MGFHEDDHPMQVSENREILWQPTKTIYANSPYCFEDILLLWQREMFDHVLHQEELLQVQPFDDQLEVVGLCTCFYVHQIPAFGPRKPGLNLTNDCKRIPGIWRF